MSQNRPVTSPRLVSVQPTPFAAVTRQVIMAEVPRELIAGLDVVWAAVRREGFEGLGRNVAVYRHLDGEKVVMTCGVQVTSKFHGLGEVFCDETPGGDAVAATHVGPYERLGDTYASVARWVNEAGLHLADVNWEIYGDWEPDARKLETEVYMLLSPN
jgi:effector-binding domain-containing protein